MQLGKYEILRTLGQGAMGEVYLAHHPAIGREVAIKTILPSAARGADAEERFRREAAAAGKLNHPNIVTIYDFDREGELLYLVMEYVKGEDLEDIIHQQSMTSAQFLEVLAQVCDGLSHAHRNGIVHRDIKPSNIRVIREGKRILAKVMDFGIARTQDSHMTSTGIVMGTVSYMAPEYIQTGRSSAQGDLWAVGVMLYECLTSRKPFGGDNTTTILFKIVSEVPPPIEPDAIRGISPSVRDILGRALSKDPATRFQTAEEFAKALRACKDPSWQGVIEATAALPGPAVRTEPMIRPATGAPTALMPADPDAPAAMVEAPSAAGAPRRQGKSRLFLGGLILAGLGLMAAGGAGVYILFGRKAPLPPAEPVAPLLPPATPGATPPTVPPAPKPVPAAIPAPKPSGTLPSEPRKPVPPVPAEETVEQKLAAAEACLSSEPGRAVALLEGLAASWPADARVQGNLLAAHYRAGNAGAFERVLDAAKASGLSGAQMMRAAPAFRQAMVDELRAHKAKNGTHLLPLTVVAKVGS